jgi:hypothetical protein
MIARYQAMAKRLSKQNIESGYGFHYANMNSLVKKYNDLSKFSSPIIQMPNTSPIVQNQ